MAEYYGEKPSKITISLVLSILLIIGIVFIALSWFTTGTLPFLGKTAEAGIETVLEDVPIVEKAGVSIIEFILRPEEFVAREASWESTIEVNEENQNLGVKISRFIVPRVFGSEEKVVLSGVVAVDTLKDEINLKFSCNTKELVGEEIEGVTDPKSAVIEKSDVQDVICSFDKGFELEGSEKIKGVNVVLKAEYDFASIASWRTWSISDSSWDEFKEEEKKQRSEKLDPNFELDPFDYYGIEEKVSKDSRGVYSIKSITHPAPINLGMGSESSQPFIEDKNYVFGITLKHDRFRWKGDIKEIKELNLYLPEGIELVKDDLCDFESGIDAEGVNVYKLKDSMKSLLNSQGFSEYAVKDQIKFICKFKVVFANDGPPEFSNVRAYADYIYETRSSPTTVTIKDRTGIVS